MISEAQRIREVLTDNLPRNWDGKESVLSLKEEDSPNWRQMEWIGWYFEWRAYKRLTAQLGGGSGATYGTTRFDYQWLSTWDFKTHVSNSGKPWAILNDSSAIESCVRDFGSMGFVIACGPAMYNDIKRTFRDWHQSISGEPSRYVLSGLESGRASRRRKTLFVFTELVIFRLTQDDLEQGQTEGWLKGFQAGMPNSNQKPRPSKLQIHLGKIPPKLLL